MTSLRLAHPSWSFASPQQSTAWAGVRPFRGAQQPSPVTYGRGGMLAQHARAVFAALGLPHVADCDLEAVVSDALLGLLILWLIHTARGSVAG